METKREAMKKKALSLIGSGYIYGATGWICTRKRLDEQAAQYPMYADLIYRYGPQWLGLPCYDCAQLTRTVARVAGVSMPSGSSTQWRTARLWKEKGQIASLPNEAGLFVFILRNGQASHTAVTIGDGETVDARGHAQGVVRRDIASANYTHWARLAVDYDAPAVENGNGPTAAARPTLRLGASGQDVRTMQQKLLALGYSLDRYGADGWFGRVTQEAVRQFQRDHGLAVDGIVGRATWQMLDALTA